MQAPANMKQFVKDLESRGWLKRVSEEVDPYWEITALSDAVMKAGGPALLFEKVKGASCPLAINLFGSPQRMALALGVERLDDIAQRLRGLLELELPSGGLWSKLLERACPSSRSSRPSHPRK